MSAGRAEAQPSFFRFRRQKLDERVCVKPRILVVEDDSDIAMALSDDLSIEGFDVEIARDGEDALRRLTGERSDLVVLDVMMPLRDGFEVCRQARRRGFDAPVILLDGEG